MNIDLILHEASCTEAALTPSGEIPQRLIELEAQISLLGSICDGHRQELLKAQQALSARFWPSSILSERIRLYTHLIDELKSPLQALITQKERLQERETPASNALKVSRKYRKRRRCSDESD